MGVADAAVVRVDGPLFYPNAESVKDRLVRFADGEDVLVLALSQTDIDVESLDMLAELAATLSLGGIELRLAEVRAPVRELLERSGLADRVRVEPTVDAAIDDHPAGVIPTRSEGS